MIENRNLIISDNNMYRLNMLEHMHCNFPTYNEFKYKRINKMAHCGCLQYSDYIFSTDGLNGLYIYDGIRIDSIIELNTDPLNLLNIYDFIVTKSGYGYCRGEDLIVTGFKITSNEKRVLVIVSVSIFIDADEYNNTFPHVVINNQYELPLYGMNDESEEHEYVIGMQTIYGDTYIVTNYRVILISKDNTSQLREFIYPNDMIRPNGMVNSNTTDIVLYYTNDIIPVYYKFDINNPDKPWYSFVDQKKYKIADAIIFNNTLLVYGDDSKIHIINDIDKKTPSIDDFIEYAGHSWVGGVIYDGGNIFIKSVNVDTNGKSRIDYMYSGNGINFDKFYSVSIPVNSESSLYTNSLVSANMYMGHGSIIIYHSIYSYFDMIKLNTDVCGFECIKEYRNVDIISITNPDQLVWYVYTDIDVPLNLKRVDARITSGSDVDNLSQLPVVAEYFDFVYYQNYEIDYNPDTNRHTLILVLKSKKELGMRDLCIDVSIATYL